MADERKTDEARRHFGDASRNIIRMVPLLNKHEQESALIALADGMASMCAGLSALAVAVQRVYDKK